MVLPALFLQSFVNILLWIPILLFILPGAWVLYLYRKSFEKLVVKYLKRDNYRPPNDITDITMCQGDSYSLPNTNCAQFWLVSGKWIQTQEFTTHFHRCFLEGNSEKYRNLYAYVTNYGTYSFFAHCKPEHLDLNWHIREYSISDFGNGTLESFAATWMTTNTYEKGRPVWQIAILHMGDPQDEETMETGIVAKFSHSLVDGYSFVHMIGKLTDNPAPYLVKDQKFTWKDKLSKIYRAPIDLLSLYGDMAFSRNSQSPFKEAARSSSSQNPNFQWSMSLTTLDLGTVKMIRKPTDVHFICLMISSQFGALRRLMVETKKESELPEFLWIGSSLPWPNHPHALTNHWSIGYFKCPLRISDPLQRLRWIEAYYREFKKVEYDNKGFFTLLPLFRLIPTWARRIFCYYDFALYNVSLFFASLMLSSKRHYLLGRPVKKLYLPLACSDLIPVALYGVTTSHSGQIDLSISACSAVVKNQDELDRLTQIYFAEELNSLADMCGLSSFGSMAISHDNDDKVIMPSIEIKTVSVKKKTGAIGETSQLIRISHNMTHFLGQLGYSLFTRSIFFGIECVMRILINLKMSNRVLEGCTTSKIA